MRIWGKTTIPHILWLNCCPIVGLVVDLFMWHMIGLFKNNQCARRQWLSLISPKFRRFSLLFSFRKENEMFHYIKRYNYHHDTGTLVKKSVYMRTRTHTRPKRHKKKKPLHCDAVRIYEKPCANNIGDDLILSNRYCKHFSSSIDVCVMWAKRLFIHHWFPHKVGIPSSFTFCV